METFLEIAKRFRAFADRGVAAAIVLNEEPATTGEGYLVLKNHRAFGYCLGFITAAPIYWKPKHGSRARIEDPTPDRLADMTTRVFTRYAHWAIERPNRILVDGEGDPARTRFLRPPDSIEETFTLERFEELIDDLEDVLSRTCLDELTPPGRIGPIWWIDVLLELMPQWFDWKHGVLWIENFAEVSERTLEILERVIDGGRRVELPVPEGTLILAPKGSSREATRSPSVAVSRRDPRGRKSNLRRNLAWLEEWEADPPPFKTEADFARAKKVEPPAMRAALAAARRYRSQNN